MGLGPGLGGGRGGVVRADQGWMHTGGGGGLWMDGWVSEWVGEGVDVCVCVCA